jgi:hypothetical protein
VLDGVSTERTALVVDARVDVVTLDAMSSRAGTGDESAALTADPIEPSGGVTRRGAPGNVVGIVGCTTVLDGATDVPCTCVGDAAARSKFAPNMA